MPQLFGRRAVLQIAKNGNLAAVDEFEGLRVRFKVTRHAGKLEASTIDVWGLPREADSTVASPATLTRLIAGYQSTSGVLISGNTVPFSMKRTIEGGETQLTWQIQEAGQAFRTVVLSEAYPGPVTALELIDRVATQIGVTRSAVTPPRNPTYVRGYSLPSSPRDALRTLCADCGCSFSIIAGALVLLPLNGTEARGQSLLIAPGSGLVGWPTQADRSEGENNHNGCVIVTSLLQPGIRLGDSFRLGGDYLAGDYVAVELEHSGDTHGEDWFTRITGRPR